MLLSLYRAISSGMRAQCLRLRVLCLLVLCLPFTGASSTYAEDLIVLSAGADPWPPYIDETLPKGGVSVQIADAALRTEGYTVVNKILPWARAIEETKQARVDLILDAWWSKERSKYFAYSRPYINGPLKFIKRKGDDFDYEGLASLNNKSIVLVRNYAYGDAFLEAKNYERYLSQDFMQSIQMLVRSRVDLTLENELVARTRIKQAAPELLEHLEWADTPLSDAFVYVICSYKHPQHEKIIAAFNRGLATILENGVYADILANNQLPVPDIFD